MANPQARIYLIPKDPEMADINDVVDQFRGHRVIQVCTGYMDGQDRMEEVRFLFDNGRELRIFSTAMCWFEGEKLMRVTRGVAKTPEDCEATENTVPPSGLMADVTDLEGSLIEEWKEMVDKEDWPKVLKAIKDRKKKS